MVKDGGDETSHSEEGETHILCEFHHWVEGLQEAQASVLGQQNLLEWYFSVTGASSLSGQRVKVTFGFSVRHVVLQIEDKQKAELFGDCVSAR